MNIYGRIEQGKLSTRSRHGLSSKNIWTRGSYVPSSYMQEHYLKITSPSHENLKVEEYIREFENSK